MELAKLDERWKLTKEECLKRLFKHWQARRLGKTDLVEIRSTDRNPQWAEESVKAVMDSYAKALADEGSKREADDLLRLQNEVNDQAAAVQGALQSMNDAIARSPKSREARAAQTAYHDQVKALEKKRWELANQKTNAMMAKTYITIHEE